MAFSDPQSNLEKFGLSEGSIIADLGAGSGFYTLAAARLVKESGKVYAVDVQQELLARLKNVAHQSKMHNVEVIHGNIEKVGGTYIRENSIDAALICNVFFQVDQKEEFLKEVKRILKVNGRILFIDWEDSFGGMGPQPEHVVTEKSAEEYLQKAGFTRVDSFDAGDHHYGFIFRKS
jgi:ubiquinone/menaquinone biosynthesis C-methylase UbiE